MTTLALEFRRGRTLLFWLGLTIVLYTAGMTLFYPQTLSDKEAVDQMLKLWPKEMLAAFSIEGNLGDPGTYFNVYIFSLIWPVIAAIEGILVGTRSTAADLDRGYLELPLATPISRTRYLATTIAVQVVAMALLTVAMILSIVLLGPVIAISFDLPRFALVGVVALAFGCAIAAASTLLGVMTLSRGKAGGIVAGVLLAMYLLQTLSKLAPDLASLSYLSAFRYFAPAPIINLGTIPGGDVAVLGSVAVACWVAAQWAFRRRDLIV